MKILAIDDHELFFLTGLGHLLIGIDTDVDYQGVLSVEAAEALKPTDCPELVLLDYFMPQVDGKQALRRIRYRFSTATVVVLSSLDKHSLIRDVVDQGAAGFISKSSSQHVLINALQLIMNGGTYLPRYTLHGANVGSNLSAGNWSTDPVESEPLRCLTARQRAVVDHVVRGLPNKVIACEMNISEGTVKSHLSAAFKILGVNSRTQAVLLLAKEHN